MHPDREHADSGTAHRVVPVTEPIRELTTATRHALLLDDDADFGGQLYAVLSPFGFAVHQTGDVEQALADVTATRPEIVFVAVELPMKDGFALCGKVKRLTRNTPVVLATRTLPWDEMALHAKLKGHATAYIDKRTIDEGALLRELSALIDLRKEHVPLPQGSDSIAPAPSAPDVCVEHALTVDAVRRLLEDDVPASDVEPCIDVDSLSGKVHELEDEVARLSQALEVARRNALSSPFSKQFSDLRESLEEEQRRAARSAEKMRQREREFSREHEKMRELASQLITALGERDRAIELELSSRREAERVGAALHEAERLLAEERRDAAVEARRMAELLGREHERLERAHRGFEERLSDERARFESERGRIAEKHHELLRETESRLREQQRHLLTEHHSALAAQREEQRLAREESDRLRGELSLSRERHFEAEEKAATTRLALEDALDRERRMFEASEDVLREVRDAHTRELRDVQTQHATDLHRELESARVIAESNEEELASLRETLFERDRTLESLRDALSAEAQKSADQAGMIDTLKALVEGFAVFDPAEQPKATRKKRP